jgi:hypothetical protein
MYPDLAAILATPGDAYETRLYDSVRLSRPPALQIFTVRQERIVSLRPHKRAIWDAKNPWEAVEAADVADYLHARRDLEWWYHTPNERSSPKQAKLLATQGVRSGVPDYSIDHPFTLDGITFGGVKIELKRRKGSRTTPEQKAWLEHYRKTGWIAEVCKGAGPAIALLEYCYGREWLA